MCLPDTIRYTLRTQDDEPNQLHEVSMTAGYSRKPLVLKLGIKPGFRLAVINPPTHYAALVEPLPAGVTFHDLQDGQLDCVHLFVTVYADFAQRLSFAKAQIVPNGMLWVSWPKKASKMPTDVTEDRIRMLALTTGLVDVKVCAVDTIWSGLKLVIPVAERRYAAYG